jgi:hypothetical protein
MKLKMGLAQLSTFLEEMEAQAALRQWFQVEASLLRQQAEPAQPA